MRYVVVPQAVRRVIPPLLNDFIGLQKDTALVACSASWRSSGRPRSARRRRSTSRRTWSPALVFLVADHPAGALRRLARRASATGGGRASPRGARWPTGGGRRRRRGRSGSRACASRSADLEVLTGIDLTVAEHEVVCLIGASGSGKSTLLRCINLLEPIDAGRIVIERRGDHRAAASTSIASGGGSASCSRRSTCSRT